MSTTIQTTPTNSPSDTLSDQTSDLNLSWIYGFYIRVVCQNGGALTVPVMHSGRGTAGGHHGKQKILNELDEWRRVEKSGWQRCMKAEAGFCMYTESIEKGSLGSRRIE